MHYGKDKTRVAKLITRNFPSIPTVYYDLEDIILSLPASDLSNKENSDQFLDDLKDGNLDKHRGKYVAYMNGIYRGNLDHDGVLYYMARKVIGRRYLDVFRVPVPEEGVAGLKASLREAKVSDRPKEKTKENTTKKYSTPPLKTHAYL